MVQQQPLDITKLQVTELESIAYRLFKQHAAIQRDLQVIEAELEKRSQQQEVDAEKVAQSDKPTSVKTK